MTAALEGGERSAVRPAALYPRERPGTHCTGGWVGHRTGLDGRKSRLHRHWFPDRRARSQLLYRLSTHTQRQRTVISIYFSANATESDDNTKSETLQSS